MKTKIILLVTLTILASFTTFAAEIAQPQDTIPVLRLEYESTVHDIEIGDIVTFRVGDERVRGRVEAFGNESVIVQGREIPFNQIQAVTPMNYGRDSRILGSVLLFAGLVGIATASLFVIIGLIIMLITLSDAVFLSAILAFTLAAITAIIGLSMLVISYIHRASMSKRWQMSIFGKIRP